MSNQEKKQISQNSKERHLWQLYQKFKYLFLNIGIFMIISSLGCLSIFVNAQSSEQSCQDVIILPYELLVTQARDVENNLTDIHLFQKFYTFQISKDGQRPATNVIQTRFDPKQAHWRLHEDNSQTNSGDDLILRLRTSLKSSRMDFTEQGMRVSVIEEKSGKVIIDGSSNNNDERRVHLDSIEVSSDKAYLIKYEFFEKNVAHGGFQDKIVSGGHMGTSTCSKPFVVQELVISSKELVKKRVQNYKNPTTSRNMVQGASQENDITKIEQFCDFKTLENSNMELRKGENGLYCTRKAFTYNLAGQNPQDLNTIYEKKFKVEGAQKESVTYLLDLTLGYDFASSAQLKALVRRIDSNQYDAEYIYNPLSCLYDHSCVESDQIGKNELNINVILNNGDYELIIFDQQENSVRRWITQEAGLTQVPFTFEAQVIPIVQNEERVMCGDKHYLSENFIQNRFIDGKDGKRFSYDENILLSLTNNSQNIFIKPEQDMILKVSSKIAYGVDVKFRLCLGTSDCKIQSQRIGNSELLFTSVKKGQQYQLFLEYANSIIILSSFFDCPHVHIKLTMMSLDDAQKIISDQSTLMKSQDWINQKKSESEAKLAEIFNDFSKPEGQQGEVMMIVKELEKIFIYPAINLVQGAAAESTLVTQRDFSIAKGAARQVIFEIFYDPQFYLLEIYIESKDANEVRFSSARQMRKVDTTLYKGSKKLITELEEGDYTFKVIAKHPGALSEILNLEIKFYEFQLYIVSAENLNEQMTKPKSLNFLGLLGPKGNNYGQMIHYLKKVVLEPQRFLDFEFTLNSDDDQNTHKLDAQVLDQTGKGEFIDMSIVELYKDVNQTIKEKKVKNYKYRDDWEEGVTYESMTTEQLKSGRQYRVRLQNKDPSQTVKVSFKLIITEQYGQQSNQRGDTILPSNFEEIKRVKPKVPGLKESQFIQGSKAVMEAFKVASLTPFVPKSQKVYQSQYQTGSRSDGSFIPGLNFEIVDETSEIFIQTVVYFGKLDLVATIYSLENEDAPQQVARSTIGKYLNSLGPATLTKGKYLLLVSPDQDLKKLESGKELIKFGLDVLLESSDIGGAKDFAVIVEQVELCNLPTLPNNFNGAGYIHELSGNSVQIDGKFRLTELLEGSAVKFDVAEASLITFYLQIPEGLNAKAALTKVKGTHATKVSTHDLNQDDETFLRQDGGFQHRGVIQIREFLGSGSYSIQIQAKEAVGKSERIMPRCEPYEISLTVTPIGKQKQGYHIGEECLNTQFLPEHLVFDEFKSGKLSYPISESSSDVAYIDLKQDGEGPFLFYFQIQHDPREIGQLGITLSKYDPENSSFKQTALYGAHQDGSLQLFTVAELGTYAIGIQTLTSTKSMFIASGLPKQQRTDLKSLLLPETCLNIKYTYFIASTLRGDSRVIQGGPFDFLSMIMGGGIQKMALAKERDSRLFDELGDVSSLASCQHDDLPSSLPIAEEGFDKSYTLLVQEKPSDSLEFVVEQESILRISVHSQNTKNQVKAFVYTGNGKQKQLLASSSGSRSENSLMTLLQPQKKAYRIKLQYDSLDQVDPCPVVYIRIILKPLSDIISENLKCLGKPLPPSTIPINSEDVSLSGQYSFSSDFIVKALEGEKTSFEYDIVLDWHGADPNAVYYLDIESRSDFLANQLTFTLLYEGEDRDLKLLGHSQRVLSSSNGGQLIERLRLLDREGDLSDDTNISGALLRLKLPSQAINLLEIAQKSLSQQNKIAKKGLCHTFELSVRAERRDGINEAGESAFGKVRLVRVRWEGREVSDQLFDSRDRLVATLEFDRSMKSAFQLLKNSEFALLIPDKTGSGGSNRIQPDNIIPQTKSLSTEDPSSIQLVFPAGTLAKGWCHQLQLNSVGGPGLVEFDQGQIKQDLIVCTSNCLCDPVGTSNCDEDGGICQCRFPHTGKDCGSCENGHTKDPETGECNPSGTCSQLGGDVDCNGHGECEQIGSAAVCKCEEAFINDGLDQCGACKDPLFDYPDCQVRNWIIEEQDFGCDGLEKRIPKILYKEGKGHKSTDPTQGEDGVLNWAGRYKLKSGKKATKQSSHSFIVNTTSVVRLFIDTAKSGVLVKYRLVDFQNQEIFTSTSDGENHLDGFTSHGTELAIVRKAQGQDSINAPYKLELEYEHKNLKDYDGMGTIGTGKKMQASDEDQDDEEQCPQIEIRLIVEPLRQAQSYLKCSDQEIQESQELRQTTFDFGYQTETVQQHIVLRDDDTNLYQFSNEQTENFAILKYKVQIRNSGNALSILTSYPFSSLQVAMQLIDDSTGSAIAFEQTQSLQDGATAALSTEHDMASFIQEKSIDAGSYTIEIAISKAQFLPTKKFQTCLDFDLVIEYVQRTQSNILEQQNLWEILAVRPPAFKRLWTSEARIIEVEFDKKFVMDDFVNSLSDSHYICSLINQADQSNIINPQKVSHDGQSSLFLHFDFSKATISQTQRCYFLKCSTQHSKGPELIQPLTIKTNYCFRTQQEHDIDPEGHCNPFASPKIDKKGNCICSSPYTGQTCESCEEGFKPVSAPHLKDNKEHIECVLNTEQLTQTVCNSHGNPKQSRVSRLEDVKCDCDQGYSGDYCDYCSDPSFAYPDCQEGSFSSRIYDTAHAHAFLARRQYDQNGFSKSAERYFSKDSLEPSYFNEECGWVDFPDDLERLEFQKEFKSSEFHVSDIYVVNHKQDNIIKFRPKSEGIFKIFLQQPESDQLHTGPAEAAFDLEIGIYDPKIRKFVASSMNTHLRLFRGLPAKLEHAFLNFQVQQQHVGEHLYIFFRALNFTDDGSGHEANEGCLSLYVEIEFNAQQIECMNDPTMNPSQDIQVLSGDTIIKNNAPGNGNLNSGFSISDSQTTFFTYQDYYVNQSPNTENMNSEIDVSVSLLQKFSEPNSLDIIVEVLEQEIEFNKINRRNYEPSNSFNQQNSQQQPLTGQEESQGRGQDIKGANGPQCSGTCHVGGEKSYNEMKRVISLSPQTYFRVWIFQQSSIFAQDKLQVCANYQLIVSSKPSMSLSLKQRKISQQLRCQAEDLPNSLNQPRYLQGNQGKQKDFHYNQNYRVDQLWDNQGHSIAFTLNEPTVFRVLAPVHRHLEYELFLNQDLGPYSHKTLIRGKREDHHIGIFAQLSAGDYHLKIAFSSDAALLQLPCQTIQLEIAMMTVPQALIKIDKLKKIQRSNTQSSLSLSSLLSSSKSQVYYKQESVQNIQIDSNLDKPIQAQDYVNEILRQSFEIAKDDDAGLNIEIKNDFLLSNVIVALKNQQTGQLIESQNHQQSSQLLISKLEPGHYEIFIYTHKCIQNLQNQQGKNIFAFDLLFEVSISTIRLADGHTEQTIQASVPIYHMSNTAQPIEKVVPQIFTNQELNCLKLHSQLPEHIQVDENNIEGQIDFSQSYFLPTNGFENHQMHFTLQNDMTAIRVMVARANSKIALIKQDTKEIIVQSRPIENGQAQLLIFKNLQVGIKYTLDLEFSERMGSLDGESVIGCESFIFSFKTWDSNSDCVEQIQTSDLGYISTMPDEKPSSYSFQMRDKSNKKTLEIQGSAPVDLQILVDYSNSLYQADLTLKAAQLEDGNYKQPSQGQESDSYNVITEETSPSQIDFSRKFSTSYLFTNIHAGKYILKLHQRFKPNQCGSPVSISVRSWKAGQSSVVLENGGMSGIQLFQSEAEEQERPRASMKLPLDLNSYKFLGPQSKQPQNQKDYILFSGPVQLDEKDTENFIIFNVRNNNTLVRVYAERAGIVQGLEELTSGHNKKIGSFGQELIAKLSIGQYRVLISQGTAQARKNAELIAPRTHITIMYADENVQKTYLNYWNNLIEGCDQNSNFPLALKQQKQDDVHKLYYNHPFIKVDPNLLRERNIVQTYNFRVNVTSRVYFEVGMHLINYHTTLQLSSLGDRQFTVQGKQRANLNSIDIQISPGDYSVVVKQPTLSRDQLQSCGLFSLQGLVEPIDLMGESANSGQIIQKGIVDACYDSSVSGDSLPSKIYGSKSHTRGGGELHVDATGHFIKRFRDVLFKTTMQSELTPQYDRVEIEVIEDAWLHLVFNYKESGANDIKVILTDTLMFNQEVKPQSSFKINNIRGEQTEMVAEFKLQKGRHYSLTVHYLGTVAKDEGGHPICQFYDLTLSISHNAEMVLMSRCPADDKTLSLSSGLPQKISDKDLNQNGEYIFEKVLKVQHPQDFQRYNQNASSLVHQSLSNSVIIDLSNNFDLAASTEFEFDQALFEISLSEKKESDYGSGQTSLGTIVKEDDELEISHLQSLLEFKKNNDHYKSVQRRLIADGVQPRKEKIHILTFSNLQPEILPVISAAWGHTDSCLYISVKIKITSKQKNQESLYKIDKANPNIKPQLIQCKPEDSPTFVHGRQNQLSFDMVFTKRPYLKEIEIEKQKSKFLQLGKGIKMKIQTLNIKDGVKSDTLISPIKLYNNRKEYVEDEYHLTVLFDISQYEKSADIKIIFAQLFVQIELFIDKNGAQFIVEKKLKDSGLPIYVFEESDTEQIIKEESDQVKEALENTLIGKESSMEQSRDVMTENDDFEEEVKNIRQTSEKSHKPVKCLCVHGKCREGQSTCDGNCDKGWIGDNCEIPFEVEKLKNVNKNQKKDISKDGGYKPQRMSNNRMTGEAKSKDQEQQTQTNDQQSSKPKKITDESSIQGPPLIIQDTQLTQKPESNDQNKESIFSKAGKFAITVIILYLMYNYCGSLPIPFLKKQRQPRNYRALGNQDHEEDSDIDDVDDVSQRRKMLELSSFSLGKQGKESSQMDDNESKSTASKTILSSFPLKSFDSQQQNQSIQKSKGYQQVQNKNEKLNAEAEEELLQKELELFAQDEEGESTALIDIDGNSENQPQNTNQNWMGDQWNQNYGQNNYQRPDDDLNELEDFFEQKN